MSSAAAAVHLASAPAPPAIIDYGSHSLADYAPGRDVPMGLGEMALDDTRRVTEDDVVRLAAVPFQTGAEAVFDHAKYFAVSRDAFAMPQDGSLQFSVDTSPGRRVAARLGLRLDHGPDDHRGWQGLSPSRAAGHPRGNVDGRRASRRDSTRGDSLTHKRNDGS